MKAITDKVLRGKSRVQNGSLHLSREPNGWGIICSNFKMEEENRLESSSSVEPEVEPFSQINYASVPDTVAPVEQPWEQQEESNKDDITELTGYDSGACNQF